MGALYEKLSKKRALVALGQVKLGTRLMCDDGFTCLPRGAVRTVMQNKDGDLYIRCAGATFATTDAAIKRHKKKPPTEQHCLCGQINGRGTHYVGFWVIPQG